MHIPVSDKPFEFFIMMIYDINSFDKCAFHFHFKNIFFEALQTSEQSKLTLEF